MKFLIQKINKEIRHDFAFTLIESARFYNWLHDDSRITLRYLNTIDIVEPSDIYPPFDFKNHHYRQKFVPIGSVDFVVEYLQRMYGLNPKPVNVPEELFHYAGRRILNGNEESLNTLHGDYFVKSNDYIKGFAEIIGCSSSGNQFPDGVPIGNYQISEFVHGIESEWRCFVYNRKLVGLQNYSGDFAKWPNIHTINGMIGNYKSAPIAYTLDVAISDDRGTFVIECHDFFSCGLYGFADHKVLPYMFYKWFWEYINKSN
jgi:hypothetical protein